ncbi:discoidin domain-containing protein [Dactylosporangium sp. CA-152071]|uniref:discoidin domain-containing protein n=1 Tax=Dactylosporangium sp. CA-152071 TaxID=3239933 RepID=UPI003D917740
MLLLASLTRVRWMRVALGVHLTLSVVALAALASGRLAGSAGDVVAALAGGAADASAAVACSGYFAVPASGPAGVDFLRLLTGPVPLLVTVFAVAKLLLAGRPPFTAATGVLGGAAAGAGGLTAVLWTTAVGSGHAGWITALSVGSDCLLMVAAWVQCLQVAADPDALERPRRRPYSFLPYVALSGTLALLTGALVGHDESGRTWLVLASVAVSTGLVVLRQFTADYDLSKPSVREQVSQDVRAYFALGLSLQELYVRNTLVSPDRPGAAWFWDTVAANARWARANERLLGDVHWIGGDPAAGAVYGTAAWNSTAGASTGMLMLRNPTTAAQAFTVDPRTVFELPGGAHRRYRFTERDGRRSGFVADAATPVTITLQPFEVAVFQAVPTDEAVGGGGLPPLSRAGWTVTADSAESAGENGAPANAADGNPATIWHTAYTGGVAPMPHHLTVNLNNSVVVDRLDYLPRQDGGTNGTIADYQILTSTDGTTWTQVAAGTFPAGSTPKTVTFTPTTARQVRLRTTRATNGAAYASAAEITLYGRPA